MLSLIINSVAAPANILSTSDTLEHLSFDGYLGHWRKEYPALEEYAKRQAIFTKHKEEVIKHNRAYREGTESYWMALNHLADLTPSEFSAMRGTKVVEGPSQIPIEEVASSTPNPDSVDWREKSAVSPVKNQGGCGSCWAFSATESIESQYYIKSGEMLILAPQTFVDCVLNPHQCGGTGGCEGATMELAFNLTMSKGIALESDVPYKGRDQTCPSYTPAVKASGFVKNPVNDAAAFETALSTIGPMSVTVAADSWQLYGGGVFDRCSKKGIFRHGDNTLDHGVQAVGYTKDYWIVRNSWGPTWGEKGFIRLSRAADNSTFVDKKPADGTACKPLPKQQVVGGECGVLYDTSYPTGVTKA